MDVWVFVIAWGGLVVPLASLAYSSVVFVHNKRRELHHREYEKITRLVQVLGDDAETSYSKIFAAHELSYFPKYKVLIKKIEQAMIVNDDESSLVLEAAESN